MDLIVKELKTKTNCEVAMLHVKADNRAAVRFYQQVHFRVRVRMRV